MLQFRVECKRTKPGQAIEGNAEGERWLPSTERMVFSTSVGGSRMKAKTRESSHQDPLPILALAGLTSLKLIFGRSSMAGMRFTVGRSAFSSPAAAAAVFCSGPRLECHTHGLQGLSLQRQPETQEKLRGIGTNRSTCYTPPGI